MLRLRHVLTQSHVCMFEAHNYDLLTNKMSCAPVCGHLKKLNGICVIKLAQKVSKRSFIEKTEANRNHCTV